jgi:hypothetical protein
MIKLSDETRLILDRYCDCVLIRYAEGIYDLATARAELAEAFVTLGRGDPAFRTHIVAVIEAGDET